MAQSFDFVETDSAKIYTTIIGSLMDYCDEPLYPGDERRIFGEDLVAVLVSLYNEFNDRMKQRTLQHARGAVLDALGERLGVERAQPAVASATFRFSVEEALDENIVIPEGTRITTDGSVYFATVKNTVLPAHSLYVDVPGECLTGGAAYNGLTSGAIGTLVDLIPYISSAQNTTISSGGDDGEPYTTAGDNRLRERIKLAPSKLSTAGSESGYRYWALTADPDIIDVAIDCPEETPTVVNIYPLMTGGALPDEQTLQKVLDACTGKIVRPLTDQVSAFAPEQVAYEVELTYYCTADNEALTVQTIEGEGGAIDQYNAWQTAALARDINPDQLRRFILAPADGTGAVRVEVTKPTYQDLTKAQVAKLSGAPVVKHEVIAE